MPCERAAEQTIQLAWICWPTGVPQWTSPTPGSPLAPPPSHSTPPPRGNTGPGGPTAEQPQPARTVCHPSPPAQRLGAEEKVKEMAAAGVIEPSSSPWAAPAVLVRKKNGEWHFCIDYRRLNAVMRKDAYPLPRIDEALDHIVGSS
ncbi:hypothetical protein AAFF_G00378670 [Aldrovandia affinis]|uniref:Transposon Ty3-I Gag-Pol polyprotein n=1 Tax=Aldrovandia affinis TaxID=143900 RepID=A0AAD7WLX5_9TELE|nr:hypothetical protein AAFF_G00378670 [Aldrovandia affinis]